MNIKCPECGTEYEIDKYEYGRFVECAICGTGFVAGTSAAMKFEEGNRHKQKSMQQEPEPQSGIYGLIDAYKELCAALGLSFRDWFKIEGRATRREYWSKIVPVFFMLFVVAVVVAVMIIDIGRRSCWVHGTTMFYLVIFLIGVAIVSHIVLLPVTVRRLHDRNMSGWFLLAFFVGSLIPVVNWFTQVAQFIIVGCLDGTVGPNDFGPDPKGRQPIQPQVIVPPQSSAIKESPEERLLKLLKLKEAGFISEGEYEEKRKKILAEI